MQPGCERHCCVCSSVCNAGVGLMGPLEVQSLETMREVLEVNLLGTLQTIQAFLPDMKARGKGHILVTGSTGGLHGEIKERLRLSQHFWSCLD